MKNIYKAKWLSVGTLCLTLLCTIAVLTFNACKKSPTDGVGIIINASIIKYQVFVDIGDAANPLTVPANVTMEVSGRDGDYVYEISGKKSFKLNHGKIDIGLNPAFKPTNSNPAKFTLNITAPGYLPLSQEVTINADQTAQIYKLKLFNLTNPPPHHHFVVQNLNMSNGALAEQTSVKVGVGGVVGTSAPAIPKLKTQATTQDPVYYDDALTSVVLPKDTKFYYYKPTPETKTGTKVVQGKDTVITENGLSKRLQTYYEQEYTYIATTYVKTYVPSNTTVQTILWYVAGQSYNYRIYDYAYQQPSTHPIQILNKSMVNEDELLYQSAVKQKLQSIYFIGTWTDSDGSHTYSVSPCAYKIN